MNKLKLLQTIQKAIKTKAFIAVVTGVVVVGGVSAYAISKNRKAAEAANAKAYVSLDTNKEASKENDNSKVEEKKVEEVKPVEEPKVEEKKDDSKDNSDNKQAVTENKTSVSNPASSNNSAKTSSSNTSTTQKSNNNTGTTSKPSTATPQPTPTPTPASKPTRQSGYDDAVTRQMSQEYLDIYLYGKSDPRLETMLAAAKSMALDGVVPDNIKESWKPYTNRNTVFCYKAHTVNMEVTNDLHAYYTRWKQIPNMCDGFNCVIAYWDASLNSYKMYYVKIAMA